MGFSTLAIREIQIKITMRHSLKLLKLELLTVQVLEVVEQLEFICGKWEYKTTQTLWIIVWQIPTIPFSYLT